MVGACLNYIYILMQCELVSDYSGTKRMMYHEQNDSNVVTIIDDEEDSVSLICQLDDF